MKHEETQIRTRKFAVMVRVEGNADFATEVMARDEWNARTLAMVGYPHALSGKLVNYSVLAK